MMIELLPYELAIIAIAGIYLLVKRLRRRKANEKKKGKKVKVTEFDEFEAELLKNPAIRKEYEALEPKYMAIKQEMKSLRRYRDGKASR